MSDNPPKGVFSSEHLTRVWLPLALLLLFLMGTAGAVLWTASSRPLQAENTSTQEHQFIFRRLTDPLHLAGRDYLWLAVLLPLLAVGFLYVGWMYRRDSVTVGGWWALFLGTVRSVVYLVLALVFLLPATQTWDKTESHSRVTAVFDVSSSMATVRDDLPTAQTPVDKLLTRQDKVLRFLTDEKIALLPRLLAQNPVHAWRFGSLADEEVQVFTAEGQAWTPAQWASWLKPDPKMAIPEGLTAAERETYDPLDDDGKSRYRNKKLTLLQQLANGTNLGGALAAVLNLESNRTPLKLVQGIIVFSDGRSNQGSAAAFEEIQDLARKARAPIFVVGIGQDREPTSINLTVLQAPAQTRGDDRFPVRVEVDGEGLLNQEFSLFLDVTRVRRGPDGKEQEEDLALIETKSDGEPTGRKMTLGRKVTLAPESRPRFGPGKPPHARVEIPIDPATLARAAGKALPGGNLKYELDTGEWRLQARVPKNDREVFIPPEHLSDPATVTVIKRPLRVLLFAGAPTREYQFVRTLLVREVDRRRAELSIFVQLARPEIVQDVPQDRLLKRFPFILSAENDPQVSAENQYYNLSQYDLIIAFDPDWSQLLPEQALRLEQWVDKQAGGLIIVGGPVNTVELTRKDNREKLKPILDLFPVVLGDVRDLDRTTQKPWRLNFPGATAETDYLKLDEAGSAPRTGWEEFFTGGPIAAGGKEAETRRGFYSYYPVEERKAIATVVATFSDPSARLRDGQEQPFLVTMPYGKGKVVFLGSGETWRLRQFREIYHERLWTKLARYAGGGNLGRLTRLGLLNIGRTYAANRPIDVEAQLFGRDLQPLPPQAKPEIRLTPPPGVPAEALPPKLELQPRAGDGEANGWFSTRFELKTPGEYGIDVVIPDSGDVLSGKFIVKEPLPEELENVRPDFDQLWQLASKVTDVAERLRDKSDDSEEVRARKKQVRDALQQLPQPALLRRAPDLDDSPRLYFDLKNAGLIPDCMSAVHEIKPSRGGYKDWWDGSLGTIQLGGYEAELAAIVAVLVALLSIEWLMRKLLKLA